MISDYFGISCRFIGDLSPHEPDCIIEMDIGKITIECKREKAKEKFVSAKESEEILGKGSKYNPIAYVTIGYPDFSKDAISNVENTSVTLVTCSALVKMLIRFWEKKLSKKDIINIMKSKTYVNDEKIEM